MNFPDEETLIWAKKKFGGKGAVFLEAANDDISGENPDFPAGVFGSLGYFHVWDETPTMENMTDGLFALGRHAEKIVANQFMDLTDSGIPGYAWSFAEAAQPAILVFLTDAEIEGRSFKAGIYIIQNNTAINVYLAYGAYPCGGSGSSGASTSNPVMGDGTAIYHWKSTSIGEPFDFEGTKLVRVGDYTAPSEGGLFVGKIHELSSSAFYDRTCLGSILSEDFFQFDNDMGFWGITSPIGTTFVVAGNDVYASEAEFPGQGVYIFADIVDINYDWFIQIW